MRKIATAGPTPPLAIQWVRSAAARAQQVAARLWHEKSPLLFGLRLWASVCLALYIAFWLELDNAYWAGTSAAIVCMPSVGASFRKASGYLMGTIAGAVFIVVLSAAFPQQRALFLLGLALWGGLSTLIASILYNYASYAAVLAGFTAAIIAGDELGAVGGTNGQVFMLAVNRASEISIGIVSSGIVLAGTDFGTARRRLRAQFAAVLSQAAAGFFRAFTLPPAMQEGTREARRGLIRRVSGLDSVIDEAIGESSEIRYRSGIFQDALDALFAILAGWATIANHLEETPSDEGQEDAAAILRCIPPELQSAFEAGNISVCIARTAELRALSKSAGDTLAALPAATPSLQLLADGAARTLGYLSHAVNGVMFLNDPMGALQWRHHRQIRVPDLLPALVNGLRAFLTIAAVSLFWVVTEWPNGAQAITFAAIGVILLSPRGDLAPATAVRFFLGGVLTSILAAIVKFALLPKLQTFEGFCLAIGLVLVPLGAMLAQPWQTGVFIAAAYFFMTLLGPANEMTYDTIQFYNSSLAIVGGLGFAALSMVLLPQLPPAIRARRLLALTLGDFRRLAARPSNSSVDGWVGRVSGRIVALPDQAKPIQFARLGYAMLAGAQIIRLQTLGSGLGLATKLNAVFDAIAHGNSQAAIELIARLDQNLAEVESSGADANARIKLRAGILLLSEALSRHGAYFDGKALE
ncbi:MAG: FUSC family protein [Rhodomicrobium sp.]